MSNNPILQAFVKRSNTTVIQVPNQVIPIICVFIIAKTPTYLLVGFVLGYMIVHKRAPPHLPLENSTKERRMIELPPSLKFNNEIHHASVNHYPRPRVYDSESISENMSIEEDEDISNGSIEFEKLMRFPPCPTTLPRIDTQFNFVEDYHQGMKSSDPSQIDWPAIHQELEYDQQRQQDDQQHRKQVESKSVQPSTFLIQTQQEMASLSSSSCSSDDDDYEEETISLRSFNANTDATIQVVEKNAPITTTSSVWLSTPLPQGNKTTNSYSAAILLVENEVEENSNEPHLFDKSIEDMLLSPAIPFPSKPSFSSPGQLFKSKFQNAVKKMKKKSPSPIQNKEECFASNNKRSNAYSSSSEQNQCNLSDGKKKARSLQIHAYSPSPSTSSSSQSKDSTALSPRPSASARMHDHFKGRLNKLFKK
jgi:hypothetical protein